MRTASGRGGIVVAIVAALALATLISLALWRRLSFSARRPRPSGLGMTGALARRVLHCLHTAGPAGIYACGAGPTTKAPMHVSAGHTGLPAGQHAWSAVFSPGIPCL